MDRLSLHIVVSSVYWSRKRKNQVVHPVIVEALRTPRGVAKPSGSLHRLSPLELLAGHLQVLRERSQVDPELVQEAVFGCVTQIGEQGGNIGKIASLLGGWSPRMSAVTINRYCASGLSAVNLAALQAIQMDTLTIGGGVEMLSRVPMMSDNAPHYTDKALKEAVGFFPPSWTSDLVATQHGFTREQCDDYAALSQARACQARLQASMPSMCPVYHPDGTLLLNKDETQRPDSTVEKLSTLKPTHAEGAQAMDAWALARDPSLTRIEHVHTAGNAPCMADGAAAVLLGSPDAVARSNLKPRARIIGMAEACVELTQTGAVNATQRALAQAGLDAKDIGLWEVRDSFAAITLHYIKAMQIELERFNVNGSSIALGHPLGATGGMLISCLLDEMDFRNIRFGVVAIAGAAGVATASVIEKFQH